MIDKSQVFDYWIVMPKATRASDLPVAVRKKIKELNSRWPAFRAVNTIDDTDWKVLYIRMMKRHTRAQMTALFTEFGLNWTVLAIRSAYKINPVVTGQDEDGNDIIEMQYETVFAMDKAKILKHSPDIVTYDQDGNETSRRRPGAGDSIYLSVYAGTEPLSL